MNNSAVHPIIYVRGYAMTQSEIEDTVADPYMGFNLGSSKVRQLWDGSTKKYFFESPLVRFLKKYRYDDVYEEGVDRVSELTSPSTTDGTVKAVPYRSIVIYRYYEPSSADLGTGAKPDMKEFAAGLDALILKLRERIYPNGASTVITDAEKAAGKQPYDKFRVYLVAHSWEASSQANFWEAPDSGQRSAVLWALFTMRRNRGHRYRRRQRVPWAACGRHVQSECPPRPISYRQWQASMSRYIAEV